MVDFGFGSVHIHGRQFGWRPVSSWTEYMLAHYPEDFVHGVCAGATANILDGIEHYPLLDTWPHRRFERVHILYTLYEMDNKRDHVADFHALMDAVVVDEPSKEKEAEWERKAARAERRMNQPWRKQHR